MRGPRSPLTVAALLLVLLTACVEASPPGGRYAFLAARELLHHDDWRYDFVIVKGKLPGGRRQEPPARLLNYEQAFALNEREARRARRKGYLAKTCSGDEIHPIRILHVTLLDATRAQALKWRARSISHETNHHSFDGTYLDTLRAYFPRHFYDGVPCRLDEEAWLDASIALVRLVKEQTGAMVIGNGAGLGSGRKYFEHRMVADRLIAEADGVQIEHFARGRHVDEDVAFANALLDHEKVVFAKCDNDPRVCEKAFRTFAGERAYLALR